MFSSLPTFFVYYVKRVEMPTTHNKNVIGFFIAN